jgi:hypothetical protein
MNRIARRILRSVSGLVLSAGLLLLQVVLPLLHETQVAVEEGRTHAADGTASSSRFRSDDAGHSHHDPSSCSVEQFLSHGRAGGSGGAVAAGVPSAFRPVSCRATPLYLPDPLSGGSSPRAPPFS